MEPIESDILGLWSNDEPGEPHLEFGEDGTFSGSDGCNGIGGEYFADQGAVRVQLGASTLKACADIDDWLRGVKTVTVDGDTMQVMNENGDEIGQLQRSGEAAE